MSTSRRAFFKGVVGGIGALALGDVILSQRGWGGLLGPTKAFAQPIYYKLADNFIFFEGKVTDPNLDLGNAPHYVKQGRRRYPIEQIIDLRDPENPRAYNLNVSGAFITRHLLADVDIDLLSKLYASRFGGDAAGARNRIMAFIDSAPNFFVVNPNVPALPPAPPNTTQTGYEPIWADFSMGSAYAIGVTKYP